MTDNCESLDKAQDKVQKKAQDDQDPVEEAQEIVIDRLELDRVMKCLTEALEDGTKTGLKRGLLHLPVSDRFLLMVAVDLVQKSQKFPNYQLKFYSQGMGEGTDTCAVTFIEQYSALRLTKPQRNF